MYIPIVLAIIMLAWLPFYIWSEYRWNQNKYLFTKLTCSLLFVFTAISANIAYPSEYGKFIILALVLGTIGDVFLVYSNIIKYFKIGLVSFLLGQIVYGTLFASYVGLSYYDLIVYFSLVAISLFVYKVSNLNLKKMKIPVLFYFLIISYMFTMAVSVIYKSGFNEIVSILIVTGASLFIVSDIILAFVQFSDSPKKYFRACNLSTYYVAQLTLGISVLVFGMSK